MKNINPCDTCLTTAMIVLHGYVYFFVVQDLMTVLMGEYKSTADYGHAWDQLGEGGEPLGRAA